MFCSKNDKNNLLIILVIIIFILLLIVWRILLAGFSFHRSSSTNENIFSQIINQGGQIKKDAEKKILELANQLPASQEQTASEPSADQLTDEEIKKIEDKILKHLDQTNQENNP